jgi:predicted nuclease of restriction endonuclease-like (RecB) superfamily
MAMDKNNLEISISQEFLQGISSILDNARKNAKTAVNLTMVYAYYEVGRMIAEEEQHGENRAAYGKQLLKELSAYLIQKFGKGFSVTNLKQMRKFYKVYATDEIGQTLSDQFAKLPAASNGRKFCLSWSHYLVLMRIKNIDERHFYEIEAAKNGWSLDELKRQFNSSLYERLLLSTEKNRVMKLAQQGQLIETPADAVKDPYILEFLGLEEKSEYSESDLENRILDNLQKFLLELGKGYTFVARQKRFTFDEEHYRVDLVFYNRLLQCFVLIDLKIGELKHQDLGQMQMYVNYYDRYEKQEYENPTIGILLCQEKNDAMVELTLPKDSNIFASKYELYLPDKKLLQEKLQEWITEEGGVDSHEATI